LNRLSSVACLVLFIALRGSDATVLKSLQMAGQATHRAGGAKVISFCNVFFFASLICGLVLLVIDRRKVARMMPKLNRQSAGYC
jgi:hypothetical protein